MSTTTLSSLRCARTQATRPPVRYRSSASRHIRSNSTTCSTSPVSTSLSPLLYHIFSEPLPYLIGLKLQHDIIDRRLKLRAKGGQTDDIVLLLEHTPTYTTGRRDNSPNPDTLHPEEKKVQHVGAEFHITKRGGQVTYHGPGQLVGYPILDLNRMDVSTRCYVDWLQGLLAGWCKSRGLEVLAPHPDGHVGIFATPTEKVASIGIHLQHRITSHGFAMNLTPEPISWFDLVTACGLTDVRATSIHDMMKRLAVPNGTSPRLPSVKDVAEDLIPKFGQVYKREMRDLADGGESELRDMVAKAEEAAVEQNKTRGWPSEPDLSKRT